eukprot:scaffold1414_cov384-Prasinococcus_capsulatus_cf.AAC.5
MTRLALFALMTSHVRRLAYGSMPGSRPRHWGAQSHSRNRRVASARGTSRHHEIRTAGRLIQKHDPWGANERQRYRQLALLSTRQCLGTAGEFLMQVDLCKATLRLGQPLTSRDALDSADKVHLLHSHAHREHDEVGSRPEESGASG